LFSFTSLSKLWTFLITDQLQHSSFASQYRRSRIQD
jgi:hypothetical protein